MRNFWSPMISKKLGLRKNVQVSKILGLRKLSGFRKNQWFRKNLRISKLCWLVAKNAWGSRNFLVANFVFQVFAKLSEYLLFSKLWKFCEKEWFRKNEVFSKNTNSLYQISKLSNFEIYPKVEVLFFLIQERKDWVHDP